MRTGQNYRYRFARLVFQLGKRRTPLAVVAVGGPQPTPLQVRGRRRGMPVLGTTNTFVFYAVRATPPDDCDPLLIGAFRALPAEMHAQVMRHGLALDGVFAKHKDGAVLITEPAIDNIFRLSPKWSVAAEAHWLYTTHVLERTEAELRLLRPPAVEARELPMLAVFPPPAAFASR